MTTFAELRRRMEEAQKKAEEDAQKEAAREGQAAPPPIPNAKQVEIDFDVKNTGAEEDDQRLRHAPGRHDDHRAREGQDARAERRPGA